MNHEEAVKLCESVGLRVRVKNDPILSTIDIPCGPITTHPMAAALIVQHMLDRQAEDKAALIAEWREAYSTDIFPEIDMRDVPKGEASKMAQRNAAGIMRHWAGVLESRQGLGPTDD